MTKRILSLIISLITLFLTLSGVSLGAEADKYKYEAVYKRNLKIYNSKSTDEYTLAYYLLPIEGMAFGVSPDGIGISVLTAIKKDFDAEIIELSDAITKNISNDYDKAKAVHDWVAGNIWYDRDSLNENNLSIGDNALSAVLKHRIGKCIEYANLTALLLRAAGIPAKYVMGFALGATGRTDDFFDVGSDMANHVWNEAFVGGKWIIMDTAWDSLNKYEDGKYSQAKPCIDEYFDISLKDISKNHKYKEYEDYCIKSNFIIRNDTQEIVYVLFDKSAAIEITAPENVININSSAVIPAGVISVENWTFSAVAAPTASKVFVDGKNIAFEAYNINGGNYFKLRDLAYVLSDTRSRFAVGWDEKNNAVSLTSGKPYKAVGGEMARQNQGFESKTAVLSTSKIYLDGRQILLTAYNIGGNNYFKLRDIGAVLGFGVYWDGANNIIIISTGKI